MTKNDFTTAFTVDQTPDQVFAAITNVRAWWTGTIDGSTDKLGDEFSYRYEDLHYSKHRITELVPGKRVSWAVVESRLAFVEDKHEWDGTTITFDIAARDGKTEVRFTHVGLVPADQCYSACSNAWGSYINGSLRRLIES